MIDDKVVIVSAKRTPIGSFQGNFESLKATELGSRVIKENINDISINPKDLEKLMPEVIKSIILCSSELKKGGFNQFRKSYNKNKYVRT